MRPLPFALLLLLAVPLHARELHWDAIEVTARLDANGTLHVRETQHFVFTGDWNGGERRFRVEEGQDLRVLGVRRIGPSEAIDLRPGGLSAVDEYRFADDVLRWRSRLPADPEFSGTPLTYEIDYELGNVLVALPGGGEQRYLLNNDFCFTDRPGAIGSFVLDLELDPAWRSDSPLPRQFTAGRLQPGESFIVRRELTYSGAGRPGTAYTAADPAVRYAVRGLLLAGIPALFVLFWRGERTRGRFARETAPVGEAWLEEHVLRELPEVIGYMYDGKSGPHEVAATLARMAQEGKISSSVERRTLHAPLLRLTLREGDLDLQAQELQLVNMFFFNGSRETDTDTIRKHYQKRGFNPGKRIEPALFARALCFPGWSQDKLRLRDPNEWRVLAVAYGLLVTGAFFGFRSLWLMIYMAVLGGVACAVGRAVARQSANRMRWLSFWFLGASVPTLLVAWLLGNIAGRETSQVRDYPFLVAAVFVLVVYWFVLRAARTEQSPEKLLVRARLAAARRWFAAELGRPGPRLRDDWAPYLIALGLGRHADRWFSSFGGRVAASTASAAASGAAIGSSSSWGSSSASAGSGGWTGGGGAFGGAGATASWALAATSLGAGSSPPPSSGGGGSSSGGGGGSSGGGSSSGGGGGGGW